MKRFFLIFAVIFFLTPLFAQTEEETKVDKAFDVVLQFEPAVYINTQSTLVSAPSPIVYPISIGFLWPNTRTIAIQPSLSFFLMYNLMYNNKALPAEIENRTTTTLCFMLNIPAVYSVYLDNSRFQFSGGAGILVRFGFLSSGVGPSDSGWNGTAGADVSAINQWFWNGMRWFYLTIGASWLYNLTPQLKAGPTINCYIPAGGIISDQDLQGMIISVGIKICR